MIRTATAAAVGALSLAAVASGGTLDPALEARLVGVGADEIVSTLVYLDVQVDAPAFAEELRALGADRRERHEVIVNALRDAASQSQLGLLADAEGGGLATRVERYWIVNALRVDAPAREILRLARRADVGRIYLNHAIELIEPVKSRQGPVFEGALEPGVVAVRAPEVWDLGFDGTGILVGVMDTGVEGGHEALASRWVGNDPAYAGHPEWAWFDPYLGQNGFPYDDGGHGTHVMGSVCGGAPGDGIGVAPGAKWMAAGAIDRGGGIPETVSDAIEAFQWFADPDGNSATVFDVPHTCSNSWGLLDAHGYAPCDETFWSYIDTLEALDCVVLFAAGNEGASGLRRPGDRALDEYRGTAIAAIDASLGGYPVASFSSRGPTFCTDDGSAAIKPDVAAPGVNVRSASAGTTGGYHTLSGTSMATPHVNGVVALVRQANPDLSPSQVKEILYQTALDLGTSGEDNSYGHGLVDAYEAVQLALTTVAMTFSYPLGRPELIDPAGGTELRVDVTGQASGPDVTSGLLHYRADGGAFATVPIAHQGGDAFLATFPALPCGAAIEYYVTMETVGGDVASSPFTAPDVLFSGLAFSGETVLLEDDMESDAGWSVQNDVSLTGGGWARGVPLGGGDRGDPADDADGSGQCWLTDPADGNTDVDGGPTILTSPSMDATGVPDAQITYARWFTNDDFDADVMVTELSNDGGATWTTIDQVGHLGAWQTASIRIADYMAATATIRLRFTVSDNPNDSVTEAGIDAIRIASYYCNEAGVPGDVDGDGAVNFDDLVSVLAAWGPCGGCPQDIDGDGLVGFSDLLVVLANFDV